MLLLVIYLAFVGLGLPDSLLGSAWPIMHAQLGVPVSAAGAISMTISACTITSALLTGRLVRSLGTGRLTLCSVALTAVALVGFSFADDYWQLLLWAIPYGLGAGAVDASLNACVALNYEPRHMNWLHCMWGVGVSLSPAIMSWQLAGSASWHGGYLVVGMLQAVLVAFLLGTLGLWRRDQGPQEDGASSERRISHPLRIPGLIFALAGFFCYCALESSCGLWAATFMVMARGVEPTRAALFASLFFIGITLGRLASGFLTLRLSGRQLLRLGETIIACGVLFLLAHTGTTLTGCGLVLVGLGCAPIYPQMIQLTPTRFGSTHATQLMGLQMACAYVGSLAFPPACGLLVEHVSPEAFPVAALALLVVMTCCLELCDRVAQG